MVDDTPDIFKFSRGGAIFIALIFAALTGFCIVDGNNKAGPAVLFVSVGFGAYAVRPENKEPS